MGIESRFWVRVLLLDDIAECTIEIPSTFRIVPAGPDANAPKADMAMKPLRSPAKIGLAGGRLVLDAVPLGSREVVLSPERPHIFGLNGQDYRGRLQLVVNRDGRSFDAINLVPLEPYLAGVVGREMPDRWKPQALQAQAIAARTYALFIKNRFGVKRRYDVTRTQASQVYGGLGAESPKVWDAVNSTCGQVLITPELTADEGAIADGGPGSESGATTSWMADLFRDGNPQAATINSQFRGLFPAYFSSICGGYTISSEAAFGDSYGPLQGAPCPYCQEVAPLRRFYWPMATFDRATVTKQLSQRYPKLLALGGITDLTVVEERCYGPFSRLTKIRLTGATGKTDTLRGEDLRLALDPSGRELKSTICRIIPWGDGWAFTSGRGWGHGVGMCQHGAEAMARRGRDAQAILRHYYPGAEIVNVY